MGFALNLPLKESHELMSFFWSNVQPVFAMNDVKTCIMITLQKLGFTHADWSKVDYA